MLDSVLDLISPGYVTGEGAVPFLATDQKNAGSVKVVVAAARMHGPTLCVQAVSCIMWIHVPCLFCALGLSDQITFSAKLLCHTIRRYQRLSVTARICAVIAIFTLLSLIIPSATRAVRNVFFSFNNMSFFEASLITTDLVVCLAIHPLPLHIGLQLWGLDQKLAWVLITDCLFWLIGWVPAVNTLAQQPPSKDIQVKA